MHCYRRISEIKAISFDLDDTLYENGPILSQAENAQLTHIHKTVPEAIGTDLKYWRKNQKKFAKKNPEIAQDMAKLRLHSIYKGLIKLGLPDKDAHVQAESAFDVFHQERVKVEIAPEVRALLLDLKRRYKLIALTNGTAEICKMGLDEIFEFSINAGPDGVRQKPANDMYHSAAERLGIAPQNLLHIGDSLGHDVKGALNAGCIALWANFNQAQPSTKSALPHLEIQDLEQLRLLLE